MLVTCDGSFGELSRENYVDSEARIASELHAINKPFVIVLILHVPKARKRYLWRFSWRSVTMRLWALVNCLELNKEDIRHILELVLLEFPVTEISVNLPDYMNALDGTHPIHRSVFDTISECAANVTRTGDIAKCFEKASENEYIKEVRIDKIDLGCGCAKIHMELADGLFYRLIGELTGLEIDGDEGAYETAC